MRQDLFDRVMEAFDRGAIGFNRVVPSVIHGLNVSYPPVNVIKDGEGKYTIEMALAGYSKDDIKISQNSNFVVVEGEKKETEEREYYFHGIAARSFKREFPVANGVEVVAAGMKDGILSIALNNKEAALKEIPIL